MRSFLAAIFSLSLVSSAVPRAASATDSMAVVAVAEAPGPSAELAELTNRLRLTLDDRARGSVTVLTPAELKERMTGQIPQATLAELDRAYSGAITQYQKGDFEGAVRSLRAVVQDLDRLRDAPETFSRRSRAILRLARSEQTLGRTKNAKEVVERLVRVHPSVVVDKNEYPPSFRKLVDEVRASVTSGGMRRLTVVSPVKAEVFLEGRDAGSTPLTTDLPPGRYRLLGTAGALRIPAFVVDLTEDGKTVTLSFAVAEALRPKLGPGLVLPESNRTPNLVQAGASLAVERLVATRLVVENRAQHLAVTMIDVRRGSVVREARVRVGGKTATASSMNALASFLVTGQSSPLVAAAAPSSAPAAKASLEARPSADADLALGGPVVGRKTSRMLGWSAVGAAALGVGLGAFAMYEGAAASESYDHARLLLRPDGTLQMGSSASGYEALVDEGDQARAVALGAGGAAAACAAVSGVLGYLSYKQSGEIGPFRF